MIRVKELSKKFRKIIALNNVSFCVGEKEILGLLGPNGAGKTILIRVLSSIIKPTSGSAFVNGFDVSRQGDKIRKKIGTCPEFPVTCPLIAV